jgi:1-acyl-sn-glycerol-3-phosphate acyltransferase
LKPWLPAGITAIEAINPEQLTKLYHQFQAGKIRFLMAFRHPEVDDPLCMFHLLSRGVPQIAHQQKIPLQSPIHSHFIYDRGMTIWAGNWLGYLFAGLGGIPIHRGKRLDRTAIRAARELFMNGKFPLAVAPEGATNGHSQVVSVLEPGAAQLGFWCVEDLAKAGRSEQVWIVPISIQYSYTQPPWKNLNQLLRQLETDTGLPIFPNPDHPAIPHPGIPHQDAEPNAYQDQESACYQRLLRLAEYLLSEMEHFYRRFYHQPLATPAVATPAVATPAVATPAVATPAIVSATSLNSESNTPDPSPSHQALIARLQRLLDGALRVSEHHFALSSEGTVIERCRRLEEAGWQAIYRDDIPDLGTLSAMHRGLADWVAEDAELRIRHMRLVESFVAVTGSYIQGKPTVEQFAELALLLFDLVARLKGQKMPLRPQLGWRRARITVGEPISVSDRWADYHRDRQSAKQAINQLTQDLQQTLESLIKQAT